MRFFIALYFIVYPVLYAQNTPKLVITSDRVMKEASPHHAWYHNAILVKWTLKELKTKYNLQKMAPLRCVEEIKKGTIDASFGVSKQKAIDAIAHFPETPLKEFEIAVFSRTDNRKIEKIRDIKELKGFYGVWLQSEGFLERDFLYLNNKIIEITNHESKYQMLNKKRADFVIDLKASGLSTIKKLHLADSLKLVEKIPLKPLQLYIAFNKKTVTKDYVKKFNNTLKRIKNSKRYEMLISGQISEPPY